MLRPRELSRSVSAFAAKTPTLLPATHTNSYALGGRDVVLVEPATPYEDEQRAWIEWARALRELDAIQLDPELVQSTLGLLLKYQDDIARVDTAEVMRLLEQMRDQAAAA